MNAVSRGRRRRWPLAAALAFSMTCNGAGTTVSVNATERDPTPIAFVNATFALGADFTPVLATVVVSDGAVVYAGPAAGAPAAREHIDLGGAFVVPGFADAHLHMSGIGFHLERADLFGAKSFADVVARAVAAAGSLPPGVWVQGRGWNETTWPGAKFPDNEALTRAIPDRPAWLRRSDGHAGIANARALQIAGVGRDTPDPPGGRIERRADGTPTGVLVDAATDLVTRAIPAPDQASVERAIERAQHACLELGITAVHDMGVDATAIAAYENLERRGKLVLRVWAALSGSDEALWREWRGRAPRRAAGRMARFAIGAVKFYADGALGSRGAALLEPYSDDPANLGLLTTSTPALAARAGEAAAHGWQMAVHAIGDRGALVVVDALAAALPAPELARRRWRLEHAQVVRREDIERMGKLGIVASMQPAHCTSDMPWADERLGPHREGRAYAWRQMLDAGVPLAFGSDAPNDALAPLANLHAAVTRQDAAGVPPGGWTPREILTRAEALRAMTHGAAFAAFAEKERGTIEKGKRADFTVLGENLFSVAAARIPAIPVRAVIIDGVVVFNGAGTEPAAR